MIPRTPTTDALESFVEGTGMNLSSPMQSPVDAARHLRDIMIPDANNAVAVAKQALVEAKRTMLGSDIESLYDHARNSKDFEHLDLGDNPVETASERLIRAERVARAAESAPAAAEKYLCDLALDPGEGLAAKLEKAWEDQVLVTLDPEKTTVAQMSEASAKADEVASLIQIVVELIDDPTETEKEQLRQAFAAHPDQMPRVGQITAHLIGDHDSSKRPDASIATSGPAEPTTRASDNESTNNGSAKTNPECQRLSGSLTPLACPDCKSAARPGDFGEGLSAWVDNYLLNAESVTPPLCTFLRTMTAPDAATQPEKGSIPSPVSK